MTAVTACVVTSQQTFCHRPRGSPNLNGLYDLHPPCFADAPVPGKEENNEKMDFGGRLGRDFDGDNGPKQPLRDFWQWFELEQRLTL